MTFRIRGLDPAPFRPLFGQPAAVLAAAGAERHVADACPGFPDRIELIDARPGETLLLVNYVHQPAANPYHASHAIFVREGAGRAYDRVDEIPPALAIRPLSLRGFDAGDRLVAAELAAGEQQRAAIARLLGDRRVAYLQAHYARPGCYAARIERA
jgi:putative intracellular protease/amidase